MEALTTAAFVTGIETVEDIVAFASKEDAHAVVAAHFPLRIAFPRAFRRQARPRPV